MKTAFIRYSPLLLLAIAWELAARLELVSTTALPPLSDVIAAWIDMIKDGELDHQWRVLALPRRRRPRRCRS